MSNVGSLLSDYRRQSRLSQLDLSLLADVSSRHISFIETGKTNPSRPMLMRLAEVLNLSLKDSNLLLNSGGYTAAFSEFNINSEEMTPVREALKLLLDNHNPFPALAMDGNWNLVMMNKTQEMMLGRIADANGAKLDSFPNNLLEAIFREDGFRPYISNWDQVGSFLLRRLRRQALTSSNPEHLALFERILTLAPPKNWQQPNDNDGPMLTVDFKLGEQQLSMFTVLSQFGTALDVGMEELIIESYFPADDHCRDFFLALSGVQ